MKLYNLEKSYIESFEKCVVFGYGNAGKIIAWYISNVLKVKDYFFCDNDVNKHDFESYPPVVSVEEANRNGKNIFLIGFLGNEKRKIQSAILCLENHNQSGFLLIDMKGKWIHDFEKYYTIDFVKKKYNNKKEKERIKKVEKVCFCTIGYTKENEENPGGGPLGAICMQKRYLGNHYLGVSIEYPFFMQKFDCYDSLNKYAFITIPLKNIDKIIKHQNNTIYFVNDLFSAFALYIYGKNYCLIYHGQGDLIEEMQSRGVELLDIDKRIIREIELVTVKNAYRVFFPSDGAEFYFKNSFEKEIIFNSGIPLYNTIYDFPKETKIEDIKKNKSLITFLSVGNITWLKGIDRIPLFLKEYISRFKKRVRWIIVGDGIKKKEIDEKINELYQSGINIEYINLNYRISHSQIFYLMNICDVYIMLHRISIFDFSTLEAMYCRKAIILSDIFGNNEYSKENNVFLVNKNSDWNDINSYITNAEYYGIKNRQIYDKYFAEEAFVKRYHTCMHDFIYSVEMQGCQLEEE